MYNVSIIVERTDEMKLYIVRHGQTLFNKMHRTQGWSDAPLTKEGVKGAKLVGDALKQVPFDYVYYSDLGRQRNTAKYIIDNNINKDNLTEIEDLNLRESFFGSYEGSLDKVLWTPVFKEFGLTFNHEEPNWNELGYNVSNEKVYDAIHQLDPNNLAESYQQFSSRVKEFANTINSYDESENILIVSSGGVISLLLEILSPDQYNGVKPDNSSISILNRKENKFFIEKLADTTHLKDFKKNV